MPTFLSNASFALVDATLGFRHGTTATPLWKTGTGTPEGVVAAPVGSLYSRLDGGTDTAVYRKETGTGNTGWVATSSAIAGVSSVDGRTGTVTLSDLYVDIAGDTMTGNLGMGVTPTSKLHFVASTTAAGGIQFGSDTNIYRSAVDTLRTDDSLSVGVRVDATSGFRHGSSTTPSWTTGTGTPEGVVTAPIGSLFSRTDGSTGTAVYRKESGVGNTGWVAVSTASGVASVDGRTGVVTLSDLYVDIAGDNMTGNLGLGAPGPTAKLQFAADTTAVGGILFGTDTTLYRSGPDVLQTDDAFKSAGRIEAALSTTAGGFRQGPAGPMWVSGSGTPEGAVTAPVGSLYSRTNGSANTTLYRKESGTLSTGWIATSSAGVSSVDGRNGTVVLSDLYVDITGDTMTGELHAPVVSVGIASATAGQIRLSNDDTIQARNAANSADLVMLTASVNNYVQVGANGQVGVAIGSGTGRTLWVAATSNPTTAAGGITFGTSADTNLYRSAADTLKTDDSLVVGVRVDATSGFRHGSALLPSWTSGAGTPEAAVTAPIGSLFSRTDGSTGTAVYRKEAGTGNTGWVAASSSAGGVTSVDGRTGVVTLADKYVDVTGDTMTGDLAVNARVGIGSVGPTAEYKLRVDHVSPLTGYQLGAYVNNYWANIIDAALPEVGGSDAWIKVAAAAGTTVSGGSMAYGVGGLAIVDGDGAVPSAVISGVIGRAWKYGNSTVGSLRSFSALGPQVVSGPGNITNAYGMVISPHKITGVTNGYGIYQLGANDNNYFGGRVAIGSTDFSYALHVNRASGIADGNAQAQRIYHSWTTTADTSGAYLSGLGVTMSVSNSAGNTFTNAAGESISGISGVGLVTGAGAFNTSVNGVTATISKYSTSTLSSGRAVNATSPNIVGGTIATATGVEIGSQKVTGVTTGYGIYQRGANDINYFAGFSQVGAGYGMNADPGGRMAVASAVSTDTMMRVGSTGVPNPFNSATTVYGIKAIPVNNGLGDIYGLYTEPTHVAAGGAVSALVGGGFKVRFANATGTLTHGRGISVGTPIITAGGIVTNAVGVYIDPQEVAGVTNGYGIYQSSGGDTNFFAGDILPQGMITFPDAAGDKIQWYSGIKTGVAANTLYHDVPAGINLHEFRVGGVNKARVTTNSLTLASGVVVESPSGFRFGSALTPSWTNGAGSPEGVVTAPVGSMYSRTDGGADTALYRKETGAAATGWVPIADVYVATSAPAGTPNSGDLWYDTDETSASIPIPLTIANGGTSASTAAAARSSLSIPFAGNSASTAGAPTSGTYVRGDYWLDSVNVLWVCTVAGTPGTWTSSNSGEELAYNQITAAVAITTTAAAASNLVIEGTTRSYDGSPVIIEFFSDCVQAPNAVNAATFIQFLDGGTDLGLIGEVYNGTATAGVAAGAYGQRRITPTAGTHNYRIGGYMSGGANGWVFAGPGTGSGLHSPAFIRVTRA